MLFVILHRRKTKEKKKAKRGSRNINVSKTGYTFIVFQRKKKYDKLHHAPRWGGMTMSVSCNIFMIFIEGECKLLRRVFKDISWLQCILGSLAVTVKTHNTVFHRFTGRFARCTCQLLLCELLRWFLNSTFHYRFIFVVVVSNGLLSDVTSFHLQTESNSLIEHNVSAAWCQSISKCLFFLVNFHNIYGKFTY